MEKSINSKTIIGAGLIMAGIYLFSGGIAHKIVEKDNIRSAKDISESVRNAAKTHEIANFIGAHTVGIKNVYE